MIYETINKMGHKTPTGIYWTILELKGLLEDEESCVYFERHRKHIGMHPSHVRNVNLALREILNSKLNSYDSELNGLLLAYKNPTLLSPYAATLHDTCYIHMDIEADFYIFKPQVGTKLKGFVNKIGLNHIGVLVHKVFIASIPQAEEEEDWPGNKVKMGQEIKFTVNQVDFSSKLPYIRGVLYEDEYLEGCKLFNNDSTENNEITETAERKNKNISFNEDFIADPSGISARKRKRITFDSDSEEEEKNVKPKNISFSEENSQETENDLETEDQKPKTKKSHKKAKKSKKKIKIEYESDEMESVLRKIKTEPCDDSVKVKKEPSKPVKCKVQKHEDSD